MKKSLISTRCKLVAGIALATSILGSSVPALGQMAGGLGGLGGTGGGGGFGTTGGFGGTGGGMGGTTGGQPGSGMFGSSSAPATGSAGLTPSTFPGVFGGPGVSGNNTIGNMNARPLSISGSNGGSPATNVFGVRTQPTGGGATGTGGGGLGGGIGGGFGGLGGGAGGLGGGLGGMGLGGIGGLAGGMNARNRMGQTGGTNGQGKKAVRTIARPDFEIKASSLPNVNMQVQQRLAKFPVPEKFRGVNAGYESGEVVLRGVVATEADKRLMERLLKLEPGVDSIRNELTVQATPSESVQAVRRR